MIPEQIQVALGEIGVQEYPGPENNPRVLEYLDATPIGRWSPYDVTPWCGAFMAWTCLQSGLAVPQGAHRARSWLRTGEPTQEPQIGAVAVLQLRKAHRGSSSRKRTGSARGGYHVGWFLDMSRGSPVIISGNASDRVGIDVYSARRWVVRGFRKT